MRVCRMAYWRVPTVAQQGATSRCQSIGVRFLPCQGALEARSPFRRENPDVDAWGSHRPTDRLLTGQYREPFGALPVAPRRIRRYLTLRRKAEHLPPTGPAILYRTVRQTGKIRMR